MGMGIATEEMMFNYVREYNKKIGPQKLVYIIRTYILESKNEGVSHDVAFIQMCHETNFLRFGGAVLPSQNNFCGLGTISYDICGACFFTIRDGIRAHIQHLKAYGSKLPLNSSCLDPRFDIVERGCAKDIHGLTGKWASDGNYGNALKLKLDSMLNPKKKGGVVLE
jgi:hypothetical protein